MVNTVERRSAGRSDELTALASVVRLYVVVALGTIGALAVLSAVAPDQAPQHAWGHAVVIAVFAVLLPLRLRAARHGSARGLRAVGLIASLLLVVNVVEALIPGFVPEWMRIEMLGIAALMAVTALIVRRAALRIARERV